jgi:hypothetical protein
VGWLGLGLGWLGGVVVEVAAGLPAFEAGQDHLLSCAKVTTALPRVQEFVATPRAKSSTQAAWAHRLTPGLPGWNGA